MPENTLSASRRVWTTSIVSRSYPKCQTHFIFVVAAEDLTISPGKASSEDKNENNTVHPAGGHWHRNQKNKSTEGGFFSIVNTLEGFSVIPPTLLVKVLCRPARRGEHMSQQNHLYRMPPALPWTFFICLCLQKTIKFPWCALPTQNISGTLNEFSMRTECSCPRTSGLSLGSWPTPSASGGFCNPPSLQPWNSRQHLSQDEGLCGRNNSGLAIRNTGLGPQPRSYGAHLFLQPLILTTIGQEPCSIQVTGLFVKTKWADVCHNTLKTSKPYAGQY